MKTRTNRLLAKRLNGLSVIRRVLIEADVLQRSQRYVEGYLTKSKVLLITPFGRSEKRRYFAKKFPNLALARLEYLFYELSCF